MIIADTSGLLAFFNRSEPRHAAVAEAIKASDLPIVVSPFVLAELDYLVATRIGVEAELSIITELASGAYALAEFGAADLAVAANVIDKYRDQKIGVTDASLVVLANRFRTLKVLTLDRRHFSVVRSLTGEPFEIVPA